MPRTVFIDLDPEPINSLKKVNRKLNIESFVTGKEGAANCYTRGFFVLSHDILEESMDKIRTEIERCSNLASILVINSCSGGTGGGFCAILIERISLIAVKCAVVLSSVMPSPDISNIMLEPYNFAWFLDDVLEKCDMIVCYNNKGLYGELQRQTGMWSVGYDEINEVVASSLSSLTLGSREVYSSEFGSSSGACSLSAMSMNMCAYKDVKLVMPSISHLVRREEVLTSPHLEQSEIVSMLTGGGLFNCFSKNVRYQSTLNVSRESNLSSCLVQRGSSFWNDSYNFASLLGSVPENALVSTKKPLLKVLDYETPSFPLYAGSIIQDSIGLHESYSYFRSSSRVGHYLSMMTVKFEVLFRKRAFVHLLVGCGIKDSSMYCPLENLKSMVKLYESVFDADYTEGQRFTPTYFFN